MVTYIILAILSIIDPDQFGAIPNSSTTYALTSMTHNWDEATDATVRIMLLENLQLSYSVRNRSLGR